MQSPELLDKGRLAPRFFTRKRLLDFPTMLVFLLTGLRGAVQSELDQFFANLRDRASVVRTVTQQAFSKARYQISALVFDDINRHLLETVEKHLGVPRWRGRRVVAADGSAVRLTVEESGVRKIVAGVAFGMFLPGIELFLSLRLHEPCCNERQMLFEALDLLTPNDILVLDRGFPCRWLPAALIAKGIDFCIRCDGAATFVAVREFLRSGDGERVVSLPRPYLRDAADYECPPTPTTVRLVRVVTPNGTVHVIMTSLMDQGTFPAAAFAELYHQRWRIEEAFKRLKHRLALESTSGLSWHAARQDFGAKAITDNLNALAAYVATDRHLDPDRSYKINRTLAFPAIKRLLGRWLLFAKASVKRISAALEQIAMNLQPFRPGRVRPRIPGPKPHDHFSYKKG